MFDILIAICYWVVFVAICIGTTGLLTLTIHYAISEPSSFKQTGILATFTTVAMIAGYNWLLFIIK